MSGAKHAWGVTLVELLTSLSVFCIVGSLSIPTFNQLRLDTQRTAAVNDFSHALLFARSTALTGGVPVSVCPSLDGATCASGRNAPWQTGWIVFRNANGDEPAYRDDGEELLAVYQGWPGGHIASNRRSYSFRPYNHAVINGTVIFCDRRGSEHARAIIVNHAGRPRIARRDSSNRLLNCQGA